MISAEVICDSISEQGKRLTTFKLRYPKFIHGEFMTHRVISRNASSSRAVPTSKLLEEVRTDALRAGPVFWGKNQKGMQAVEELDDTQKIEFWDMTERELVQQAWRQAAILAAEQAETMMRWGAHKQLVNRLLEPFSHINVIATATEWDNFFGLRLHKDAQPEMRALAIAMWEAYKSNKPKLLKPGEWHRPFITEEDEKSLYKWAESARPPREGLTGIQWHDAGVPWHKEAQKQLTEISVARCARVSFMSFETGKRSTVDEDLKLYDKLVGSQPLHASPAEHQATPIGPWAGTHETSQQGNFVGWRQYRKMLPGENCAPLPEEFR